MNLWFPRLPVKRLVAALRLALLGALAAGVYGALHDQVSFTVSPEYFTKLKFNQFRQFDFGWPPRAFAALVGCLGSWWVGLIAGWILARLGLAELTESPTGRPVRTAFAIAFGVAILTGTAGALLGLAVTGGDDLRAWAEWQQVLDLHDVRAFAVVAYLHAASYLGGLLGLFCASVYVRRKIQACRSTLAARTA